MPLIIPKDLPAYEELQQENVFVMHQERAMSQHIRPLRILILNLMPTKIVTETQLARLLANSPLQVQVTFLQTATHSTTHTAPEHMKAFYKTFDEIKNERFDGMIITGAPIEDLDYEDVDYWDELCRIMDYTKENVYSTIHLCWGALAGLYYHFGIPKVHLDKKMFGVFEHRVTRPSNPLVRGFDEVFYAPHSRWAGLDRAAIDACGDLRILAESDIAGPMLLSTESGRQIFVIGHPEYDKYTLDREYKRDVKADKPINIPCNYYPDDDPSRDPLFRWRAHGYLLYTPFFMCNYIFSAFVRNDGDPSLAMVATLSGSLFNVVFDYIFMFPMGLGLAGAALATAVSPIISISICSRHFFKKKNSVQFVRQRPSARLLGQSCQLGISGFVGEMSSGVTTTVFNFLLLRLAGNVGVAAYGVVANFALVATAIFNGVAQGAQPLVSRCYGKNDAAGAHKLLLLGSGTALALAAALYAVLFGFTGPIVAVFNSENSALMAQYAFSGMRIYFLGYFFAGFNIVAAGYLGAVDRPAEASATSLSRGIVAIVACSLVLSALFGMNGVWAAFPASEAITACLTLFLLKRKN